MQQNVKTGVPQNVYLGLHQNGLSVEADDREAGGHGEEVDCHAALVFIELTFFSIIIFPKWFEWHIINLAGCLYGEWAEMLITKYCCTLVENLSRVIG